MWLTIGDAVQSIFPLLRRHALTSFLDMDYMPTHCWMASYDNHQSKSTQSTWRHREMNVSRMNVSRMNVSRMNVSRMNVSRMNVSRMNVSRMNVSRMTPIVAALIHNNWVVSHQGPYIQMGNCPPPNGRANRCSAGCSEWWLWWMASLAAVNTAESGARHC